MKTNTKMMIGVCSLTLYASCAWGQTSSNFFKDNYTETVYVHQKLVDAPDECFYNLFNLYSNALADGLVVNGARTGLGTDVPAGEGSLQTDSLYYQLVRIYSYFDWEMGRQLRLEMGDRCLPSDVSLGNGMLPKRYVASFPTPYVKEVSKVKRALQTLSPDLPTFEVVRLDEKTFPQSYENGIAFTQDWREQLRMGVLEKLRYIETMSGQSADLKEKLMALGMAYNPLALTLNAHFPDGDKSKSQLWMEGYLPPIYEIDIPDVDRVETWTLNRGLSKTELPKSIDISIAKLTHLGYLYDPTAKRTPLIKFQLFKDFSKPDEVQTRVFFGELADSARAENVVSGVLPIRIDDYRNALFISFYPNLAVAESDNFLARNLKEMFNRVANQYRLDARIHRLNLSLVRPASSSEAAYDSTDPALKPRFNLKESDISFRMHRYTDAAREMKTLQGLGFRCEKTSPNQPQDCFMDFGAYDEFLRFLENEDSQANRGGLGTSLFNLYKQALNLLARLNTKLVIDLNIRGIEDAIDVQFVEILEKAMEKQDEARDRIRDKLSRKIFE